MREHEAKSVEQNVDTLFRRQPAHKEDLFGFALDARRRGEVCDIHAVVNMMASLCQRGEAPAHACSDEVTAAEHQIGGIDPSLDHCCVKLLEPLTMHMQDDPGLWQPRTNKWDELGKVLDVDDIAVLLREVRDDLADELPVPQCRAEERPPRPLPAHILDLPDDSINPVIEQN